MMRHLMASMLLVLSAAASGQEQFVPLKYGDMEQWVVRTIHESSVIGGADKRVDPLGPSAGHGYMNCNDQREEKNNLLFH